MTAPGRARAPADARVGPGRHEQRLRAEDEHPALVQRVLEALLELRHLRGAAAPAVRRADRPLVLRRGLLRLLPEAARQCVGEVDDLRLLGGRRRDDLLALGLLLDELEHALAVLVLV